jgi:hypothetical protein
MSGAADPLLVILPRYASNATVAPPFASDVKLKPSIDNVMRDLQVSIRC